MERFRSNAIKEGLLNVFSVRVDVNRYQYFLPERDEDTWTLYMDGTPKANVWVPPPVYILYPKHIADDFYNFNRSVLIASPRATEALRDHFTAAGELLSLPYQDDVFTLLNVTQRINVLDEDRTEWIYGDTTGVRIGIKKHVFHANRFVETTLFKMQWGRYGEVFVLEGANDLSMEFRDAVGGAGLKGLIFSEIWNDEE
jgi:hypothetical protein